MNYNIKMPLYIILFSAVIYSCNVCSDLKYIRTEKIENHNVYIEKYESQCGVYGGNYYKYYANDSIHPHFLIGSCDDKQYLTSRIENNELIIEKHSRRNHELIETEKFDLP